MATYETHKRALRPLLLLLNDASGEVDPVSKVPEQFNQELVTFLLLQGLAGHWYDLLGKKENRSSSQEEVYNLFKDQLKQSTFTYLDQLKTIHQLHRLFNENNITYAVYKGTHIREVLYDPPSLRDAADIDVLISPRDRAKAIKLLVREGFTPELKLENISVEASFTSGRSSIDLHWNVMRERRSKENMVDSFLAARIKVKGFYSLKTEDQLFIMLVHPVFAKYLTAPHARLSNVIDLYRWITKYQIDWNYLVNLLKRTHLKTAAWLTGSYGELLTGIPLPPELMDNIKPPTLKTRYLRFWINKNLSTRLFHFIAIPKILFTLLAHDSLTDAWSFVLSSFQENKRSKQIMAELEDVIAKSDE